MSGRITVVLLVFVWNWSAFISMAETAPLAVAELAANRAIAEADLARTQAEQDLAKWKLSQFETLRRRGHASWQEVAQQQVVWKQRTATALAAEQYLETVSQWQVGLAECNSQQPFVDTECIRLYLPGSLRLVGWVPADQASHALVSRQLARLDAEYESLSNIDLPPLAAAIEKAEQAVDVYSQLADDTQRLQRATISLRLARAEHDLARARNEKATIIARRLALLRQLLPKAESSSSSLARIGATFVNSTSDRELAQLVRTMAAERATTVESLHVLEQRRQMVLDRIASLEKLSHYRPADSQELEQARSQRTEIDEWIQESTELLRRHHKIAGEYDALMPETASRESFLERAVLKTDWMADATFVRHMLQRQQLQLQTEAARTAVKVQRDYLAERLTRLERIHHSARQPRELDHLRQEIKATKQLTELMDRRLVLLDREEERFLCQFKSQRGDDYQLVQAADGKFFSREEFSAGTALMAAVGFVGVIPNSVATHAYLESTAILGCMPNLASQQQPLGLGRIGLGVGRPTYESSRLGRRPSIRRAGVGLRLATDGIRSASERSRYATYDLWPLYSYCPESPRAYLRSVTAFRSHLPNYHEEYAFGIRRLDSVSSSRYRRRASSYGGPWYLPGSPTNYRD